MLIFTRHTGESFKIADDITITIISTKGRAVRVGIDAPKNIPVHREEIYRRIQAERQEAENATE